ncbi:MAG: ATP-dependent protease subunit HslV [Planctomycetota bacterium]
MPSEQFHGTTILSVRDDETVAVGGDGQVTMDDNVVKHRSSKIRDLHDGEVLVGFAGSVGDAFTLLDLLSEKLDQHQGNLIRSAHELAKKWRTDKMLRPLQSLMTAVDDEHSLLISGSGEVIEPDDGVMAIGSGGQPATTAARAMVRNTDMDPQQIVRSALELTADVCVYTNRHITIRTLSAKA